MHSMQSSKAVLGCAMHKSRLTSEEHSCQTVRNYALHKETGIEPHCQVASPDIGLLSAAWRRHFCLESSRCGDEIHIGELNWPYPKLSFGNLQVVDGFRSRHIGHGRADSFEQPCQFITERLWAGTVNS